jgi:hypothetical protein
MPVTFRSAFTTGDIVAKRRRVRPPDVTHGQAMQACCRAWIADTVAVSAITEQPSPVPADGRPPRRPGTGRPVGDPWARPATAVRSLDSNSSCASKRERAPELVTAGLTQPWIASQAGRNHRAAVRPEHPVMDLRLPAVADRRPAVDHEGSPNPGGLSAAGSQAEWRSGPVRQSASRLRRGTRCSGRPGSAARNRPVARVRSGRWDRIVARWPVRGPFRRPA